MNTFQSLDQWTGYFNNPEGGGLGLLNAIQVLLLDRAVNEFLSNNFLA